MSLTKKELTDRLYDAYVDLRGADAYDGTTSSFRQARKFMEAVEELLSEDSDAS